MTLLTVRTSRGAARSRRARTLLAGGALAVLVGCSSGGVSHTVSESAIARVTGPDKVKIDAARAQVTAAEQQLRLSGQEEKQAEAAIKQAEQEMAQVDRQVEAAEKELEKAKRAREVAETRKRLREEELELVEYNNEVRKHELILARARYELAKYEAVGRVEAGSEPAFQKGLAQFQKQAAEAQVELSAAREEAATQAAKIRDLKRQVGES